MVACGVFGDVLAFAVGVGGGFVEDFCAVCAGLGAVGVCVFYPDGDVVAEAEGGVVFVGAGLADDDCAVIAYVELDAVGVDAAANGEAEGVAEPGCGFGGVGVGEDGDDGGLGDGAVVEHGVLRLEWSRW